MCAKGARGLSSFLSILTFNYSFCLGLNSYEFLISSTIGWIWHCQILPLGNWTLASCLCGWYGLEWILLMLYDFIFLGMLDTLEEDGKKITTQSFPVTPQVTVPFILLFICRRY
ncbi:hypothetical protein ACJX0J_023246, partial [Zea mays]